MTKQDLAAKKATSAGLDRLLTNTNDRTVDVTVIPDTDNMQVLNAQCTHRHGSNRTAIIITIRNDGSAENILQGINLAIASLATAI